MPSNEEKTDDVYLAEAWATDCVQRLRQLALSDPSHQAAVRYAAALSMIQDIRIRSLGQEAFQIEGQTLVLNADSLERVFRTVDDDLGRGGEGLDPAEFAFLCQMITAVFLLHEMRHIDQGIGSYSDVKKIQGLGLAPLIAEFDLLADRDALLIFSEIYGEFFSSRLEAFQSGLWLSPNYFFRAFEFNPKEKPHKFLRAASLMLMLARTNEVTSPGTSYPPVDSVISFYGLEANALDHSRPFALIAEQPFRRVYAIADEDWQNWLMNMMNYFEEKNFRMAFACSCQIVREKELGS